MDERERINRWNEKEDLIDEVKALFGLEPQGLRRAIMVLTHPDLIEYTLKYFKSFDDAHICIRYEAPWNCAQAAHANYESIAPPWIGSAKTVVIGGDWCTPCRKHALNH